MIFAQLFVLFIYIILGIASIAYVLWLFSWVPTKNERVPYTPTKSNIIPHIVKALELKPTSVLYDLGCGDGKIIFACYKEHPHTRYVGVEFHILPYLLAKIRHLLLGLPKNITFIYGDMFTTDVSTATHVYLFMTNKMLKTLLPWLKKNLTQGTRVVSSNFKFVAKEPIQVIAPEGVKWAYERGIYVYEF